MGSGQPRERRFYLLPKIHKDPKTWTVPFQVPPGRPIVSDCGSETYHTTEYLDFYLTPIAMKHNSFVKDTFDFINIIKKLKIAETSFFQSMLIIAILIFLSRGVLIVLKMPLKNTLIKADQMLNY